MENAGAVERTGGSDAGARCPKCGVLLATGASFCGSCGASIVDGGSTRASADLNLIVAIVTLAWVMLMLFWLAEPLSAVGVDPVASLRTTLRYSGLWTLLMLPFISLLALAACLSWKAGGRARMPTLEHNQATPSAVILGLAGLTWLGVTLMLRSEPGSELSPWMFWLAFSLMLAGAWLATIAPAVHQTWKAPRIMKMARLLAYLVPIPAAVILMFVVIPGDASRNARFELSEEALTRYVEKFERTGGTSIDTLQMVGLYNLGKPGRRGSCVTLTTNSDLDYYAGFAYCRGTPPEKPNVHFDHIKERWWKFEVHH